MLTAVNNHSQESVLLFFCGMELLIHETRCLMSVNFLQNKISKTDCTVFIISSCDTHIFQGKCLSMGTFVA